MFTSLLLPVDLANATGKRRAAAAAVDLAERFEAKLHVMTVVPDFGMSIVGTFFDERFSERAASEMETQLAGFCDAHIPASVAGERHVRRGSIYDEILKLAGCLNADCIVMGAHRPVLKDYLLGPNAARVVRHAPCSVMVVRN